MTCPTCGTLLRKFYRGGAFVRVCPKCQPYPRRAVAIRKRVMSGIPIADLLAYRLLGWSNRQIADQTGLTTENVKRRLQNARKHAASQEAAA